jgi:hypothetical protein
MKAAPIDGTYTSGITRAAAHALGFFVKASGHCLGHGSTHPTADVEDLEQVLDILLRAMTRVASATLNAKML